MSYRKLKDSENNCWDVIHLMRKADIFLIIVCLLTALFISIFFAVYRKTGSVVSISCGGTQLCRIDLNEITYDQKPQYYLVVFYSEQDVHIMQFEDYPELPDDTSYNLLVVENGTVAMEAADCRDQICVNHRPIMSDMENIICLPHKLVVEMSGEGKEPRTDPEQNGNQNSHKEIDGPLDGVVR